MLASVWTSNLCFKSQNHVLPLHIITLFFPIFFENFQKQQCQKVNGGEEEGQEAGAEGGVEVDEKQ